MVDLNRLRDTIRENQQQGDDTPDDFWKKAFVDQDGKIKLGGDAAAGDGRPKSEIPQGTFAAVTSYLPSDAQALVDTYLPAGTRCLELEGVTGWLYDFEDELGQWWQLFLHHDGSLFQVQVVYPPLEDQGYDVHGTHLFAESRVCLSPDGGLPDLQEAYAKSVLWANGFSIFRHTGTFPFSINNG